MICHKIVFEMAPRPVKISITVPTHLFKRIAVQIIWPKAEHVNRKYTITSPLNKLIKQKHHKQCFRVKLP